MIKLFNQLQDLLDGTRVLDFLAPLALRLYLVPVFWMAGTNKLADIDLDVLAELIRAGLDDLGRHWPVVAT